MKIYKNNFGKALEVKKLPSNMEKGLKTKTWVAGPLTGEFIGYTKRNYETLQRAVKRGGPVRGSGRSFTIRVLNDKKVFLEGSASNQYTLKFDSIAERQKWTDRVIKVIDPDIILN